MVIPMTENNETQHQNLIPTGGDKLAQLERQIAKEQQAFYRVGKALKTIRDERLYLSSSHSNFETYCKEKWDMGKRKANYLIKAAETVNHLKKHFCPDGNNCSQIPLPINESQIRELAKLSPEEQIKIWEQIVNKVNEKEKLTANLVNGAIAEYKKPNNSSEPPTALLALTPEAKKISEAISTLSQYNVGQIRQAIFSFEGEQINLPELAKNLIEKFQKIELDNSGIKPGDSEE